MLKEDRQSIQSCVGSIVPSPWSSATPTSFRSAMTSLISVSTCPMDKAVPSCSVSSVRRLVSRTKSSTTSNTANSRGRSRYEPVVIWKVSSELLLRHAVGRLRKDGSVRVLRTFDVVPVITSISIVGYTQVLPRILVTLWSCSGPREITMSANQFVSSREGNEVSKNPVCNES